MDLSFYLFCILSHLIGAKSSSKIFDNGRLVFDRDNFSSKFVKNVICYEM